MRHPSFFTAYDNNPDLVFGTELGFSKQTYKLTVESLYMQSQNESWEEFGFGSVHELLFSMQNALHHQRQGRQQSWSRHQHTDTNNINNNKSYKGIFLFFEISVLTVCRHVDITTSILTYNCPHLHNITLASRYYYIFFLYFVYIFHLSVFSILAETLPFTLNVKLWANHLHYIYTTSHEGKKTPFPLFEEDEEQCDHHGSQTQTEHRLRRQELKEREIIILWQECQILLQA